MIVQKRVIPMSTSHSESRNGALFPEIIEVEVKFELPDWFPPERLNYDKCILYPKGHIWAGQVEKTCYENTALDSLMKLKEVKEVCFDPFGPWLTIELSLHNNFYLQIGRFQSKLQRFLNRYNEAHGKPGRRGRVKRKFY